MKPKHKMMTAIPHEIQQAMYGFMMSHVLFAGDELGIFDGIAQGKASTIQELAQSAGVHPRALERLVLAAIAMGLIDQKDGVYQIPEHLRPFFQKNAAEYCGEAFSHFREVSTRTFPYLKEALRENQPQWAQIFSNAQDYSPFTELYKDSQRLENFLSSMWGMGYGPAKELVQKYSLDRYSTLVDVGGGSGSFAIAALEHYSTLNGIVFDLPKVSQYLENKRHEHKLSQRLAFVAGDFFQDELPTGDVYVLGYILSDWNREDGTKLLKKIYNALPAGGAILILEKLFNEGKNGPIETAMMNLAMLLETWGQHYAGSEYISWLQEIGFQNCQVLCSSGEKHMVVGIK
ncbi:MAG: class I SAM-dependent methyltransferase [Prochloron sp. SP5CPC1]|nr:class I SAM-dependent methyltransferase [Candidatus Paraprochloron terpiosi SP5CPC1]